MQSNKTFSNQALALILVSVIGIITVIFLWLNESKRQAAEIETLKAQLAGVDKGLPRSKKSTEQAQEGYSVKPISFEDAKEAHYIYAKKWESAEITAFDFQEGFSLDIKTMVEFKDADTLYLSLGMRPKCEKDSISGKCIVENNSKNLDDKIKFEDKLLTLYVYGIDSLGEYIRDPKNPDSKAPLVYEYLKPCPDQCPDKSGLSRLIKGE